jgi:hypothetical protein
MIENDPRNRISLREIIEYLKPLQPPIKLSLLQYDNQNLLCSTGTLSLVYHVGKFGGSPLAVKRVSLQEDCTTKSLEELKQLKHPNVVRFLYFDEDTDHRYKSVGNCLIKPLLTYWPPTLSDILGWNCAWHLWTNFSFQKTIQRNIMDRFRLTCNMVSSSSAHWSKSMGKISFTGQSNPPTFWFRQVKIRKSSCQILD